ncbi:hypothetical protein D3C75_644260 [compost metagenome]
MANAVRTDSAGKVLNDMRRSVRKLVKHVRRVVDRPLDVGQKIASPLHSGRVLRFRRISQSFDLPTFCVVIVFADWTKQCAPQNGEALLNQHGESVEHCFVRLGQEFALVAQVGRLNRVHDAGNGERCPGHTKETGGVGRSQRPAVLRASTGQRVLRAS